MRSTNMSTKQTPQISARPWIACKAHEDEKGQPYFEIEEEEAHEYEMASYTSIYSATGSTVVNAHDLFTFRGSDAQHIVKCVNIHDELVEALQSAYDRSNDESDYQYRQNLEKLINRAKEVSNANN